MPKISAIVIQKIFSTTFKELGSGFFGTVYKAKYKGEIIAAKKLDVTSRNAKEIVAEIVQLSKLNHQNIVRFIDYYIERKGSIEVCYIYMEFMEGKWLKLTKFNRLFKVVP